MCTTTSHNAAKLHVLCQPCKQQEHLYLSPHFPRHHDLYRKFILPSSDKDSRQVPSRHAPITTTVVTRRVISPWLHFPLPAAFSSEGLVNGLLTFLWQLSSLCSPSSCPFNSTHRCKWNGLKDPMHYSRPFTQTHLLPRQTPIVPEDRERAITNEAHFSLFFLSSLSGTSLPVGSYCSSVVPSSAVHDS